MSWSVSLIGKPAAIAEELKAEIARQSGQCKKEFDAALPHMLGLLALNFSKPSGGYSPTPPTMKLVACGSGTTLGGEEVYGSCRVTLEEIGGKIV